MVCLYGRVFFFCLPFFIFYTAKCSDLCVNSWCISVIGFQGEIYEKANMPQKLPPALGLERRQVSIRASSRDATSPSRYPLLPLGIV